MTKQLSTVKEKCDHYGLRIKDVCIIYDTSSSALYSMNKKNPHRLDIILRGIADRVKKEGQFNAYNAFAKLANSVRG